MHRAILCFASNTLEGAYSGAAASGREKGGQGVFLEQDDSSTTRRNIISGTSVPIGQFNGAGTFSGKMRDRMQPYGTVTKYGMGIQCQIPV